MYEHNFFTARRLGEFWDMVFGLVKLASPGVMISVAIACVGLLITIVVQAVRKGAKDEDEDRDFDIKYYD